MRHPFYILQNFLDIAHHYGLQDVRNLLHPILSFLEELGLVLGHLGRSHMHIGIIIL